MPVLRSYLLVFLMYFAMAVMGLVGAPVVLWSDRWTRRWMKVWIRLVFRLARLICGLRVEVRGPVPRGPVVVAGKHQSMLDVLILFDALPEARFVMKRELVWAPVFGLYAIRAGSIWIERERRGEASTMMQRLQKNHAARGQVVIYPQGTRVPPGETRPYRRGAALAYAEFGLPLVLAATNVGWYWPKKGTIRGGGTAVVEFLETLPPGLHRREVMARMEQSIEAASDRLGEEAKARLGL
ncbi:MAG TPA: lysophospholipid acyltransferase family protein [Thermohalobaculum sp.]|nr:lysophospholipid acyltransferase family protein [Thermohalobaculum sp.]